MMTNAISFLKKYFKKEIAFVIIGTIYTKSVIIPAHNHNIYKVIHKKTAFTYWQVGSGMPVSIKEKAWNLTFAYSPNRGSGKPFL